MKVMEILLEETGERQEKWYDDEQFGDMLSSLLKEGKCLQCRYGDHIVILTRQARAVFDSSGNMLELYDLGKDAGKNLVGSKEEKELAFEMIVLLSKFNMG